MSSSISIPIRIPIAIAMDSALAATVTQMAFFKPLNHRHLATRRWRFSNLHRLHCVMPVRCSSVGGNSVDDDGMMCDGCADNVRRTLESRPQVSSAKVNLRSETAIVSAVPEEKTAPNWQQQLGETLAQHLTTCGFTSTIPGGTNQEDR
ncbi:uncharacterized protein LOC113865524 isoform X2 [Abrus precatorius]|uniref:Uncharacterized protein LOC113865524 isoform X2 n=1 Tax=Abrus precatorius TaxID=3816 RepID=A0A8B8LKP6_ABRPR|nr:uncharacterized protein LOC113865524 isoform X2 [Abrus precatorius]